MSLNNDNIDNAICYLNIEKFLDLLTKIFSSEVRSAAANKQEACLSYSLS